MKHIDLKGLRVLNTRPLPQANQLTELILAAKGCPLSCPAFEIKPNSLSWLELVPELTTIDQAIFTSANAVTYSLPHLHKYWSENIKVTAIGKATAKSLLNYGIKVDYIPEISDSEHLLELENFKNIAGKKILLFKGDGGRETIEQSLKNRKAELIILRIYHRHLTSIRPQVLLQWWQEREVDIILFTSQQAMENIFLLFEPKARTWLLETPCLVISQRLADIASDLGMQKIIIGNTDSIIETLDKFKQGLIHGYR